MAAAVVDLNINEGETFNMSLEFWENSDRTEPVDITGWTFNGTFSFSNLCVPMTFTVIDNSITANIEATELVDLPATGRYTVEASSVDGVYRIQQGTLTVDRNTVCM